MFKKKVLILLFCIGAVVFCFAEDFNLEGWSAWGGVEAVARGNTVTFSGEVKAAGFVSEKLDVAALRNRTVTLEIENAGASIFSESRMIKITINKSDTVVKPLSCELIKDEYVPSSYTRIEFEIPNNFDGKLGFVFYQANLRDLRITATYN